MDTLHFDELLNGPVPLNHQDIDHADFDLGINCEKLTREKIRKVIKLIRYTDPTPSTMQTCSSKSISCQAKMRSSRMRMDWTHSEEAS